MQLQRNPHLTISIDDPCNLFSTYRIQRCSLDSGKVAEANDTRDTANEVTGNQLDGDLESEATDTGNVIGEIHTLD